MAHLRVACCVLVEVIWVSAIYDHSRCCPRIIGRQLTLSNLHTRKITLYLARAAALTLAKAVTGLTSLSKHMFAL